MYIVCKMCPFAKNLSLGGRKESIGQGQCRVFLRLPNGRIACRVDEKGEGMAGWLRKRMGNSSNGLAAKEIWIVSEL